MEIKRVQDGSVHSDSTKIKNYGKAASKGEEVFSYKGKALKNVYYVFPTKDTCTTAMKSIIVCPTTCCRLVRPTDGVNTIGR